MTSLLRGVANAVFLFLLGALLLAIPTSAAAETECSDFLLRRYIACQDFALSFDSSDVRYMSKNEQDQVLEMSNACAHFNQSLGLAKLRACREAARERFLIP